MGVPFFYRRLTTRYRRVAQKLSASAAFTYFKDKKKVKTLGLDLNGIIHTEAAKVYLYGEHETSNKVLLDRYAATSLPLLEQQHFQGIGRAIFDVVKMTKPSHTLLVCVDGPAPFPKLYQQKQRRFKAKSTVQYEAEEYATHSTSYSSSSRFDSNCITPGTAFMDRLDKFLEAWLTANRKLLSVPTIIYSSHRVPGEGEHKIAQYHRDLQWGTDDNETHVVYGLDADLIMIGLLSPLRNYTLLRDDITAEQGTSYHVLDVTALREAIRQDTGSVEDYVLLTFLAGNDFLPSFPSISIGTGGLEVLGEIYKEVGVKLVVKGRVDWESMLIFMEAFAAREPALLAAQRTTYPSVALEAAVANGQSFSYNTYRTAYYQRALGNKSKEEKEYNGKGLMSTQPMAEEWLAGIAWVFRYYTLGLDHINVESQYHYNYVPLANEIINILQQVVQEEEMPSFEWEALEVRGEVLLPYEQLVSVLPPASANLLPSTLQSLITQPTSPIVDLTPTEFLVDFNGKMKEHEGVALLPYIDGERVREIVGKATLTAREKRINSFGDDVFIVDYSGLL